jgi:hypothetical protein
MEIEKKLLQKSAKGLIDLVLGSEGQDLLYREFCEREPQLKRVAYGAFCEEYVPAKLALGCVSWVGCCASHRIEDKELKNLYFKEVMGLFGSPKSLANATRFSESLYASNADPEQSPVLGVIVHLFHKLGLEAMVKKEDSSETVLNAGFTFMMEVAEALKIVFETQFDDFLYARTDHGISNERKKA